jgi:hypothetical protein
MDWAIFWAIFTRTHLVILSCLWGINRLIRRPYIFCRGSWKRAEEPDHPDGSGWRRQLRTFDAKVRKQGVAGLSRLEQPLSESRFWPRLPSRNVQTNWVRGASPFFHISRSKETSMTVLSFTFCCSPLLDEFGWRCSIEWTWYLVETLEILPHFY